MVDDFEPGHQDRVTVLHINFDGTRILTASADHRVKVWERNAQTGQRTLTETWTAHDADIRDVLTDHLHICHYGVRLTYQVGEMAASNHWLAYSHYRQRLAPPALGRRPYAGSE
jgi:WD40 repeat protein